MSTTIGQLKAWLADCERYNLDVNDQAPVYIDDGGLTLCIDTDLAELALEIGGKPSDAPLPLFDEPDPGEGICRCNGRLPHAPHPKETPDGKH